MRIYVSGKITGNKYAEEQFKAAEDYLKEKYQATVINPFRVNRELPNLEHDEYMKMSFAEMDLCDTIYFMENWRESCGASQEMGYAIAKRKRIWFE